jgi:hypothetical protein
VRSRNATSDVPEARAGQAKERRRRGSRRSATASAGGPSHSVMHRYTLRAADGGDIGAGVHESDVWLRIGDEFRGGRYRRAGTRPSLCGAPFELTADHAPGRRIFANRIEARVIARHLVEAVPHLDCPLEVSDGIRCLAGEALAARDDHVSKAKDVRRAGRLTKAEGPVTGPLLRRTRLPLPSQTRKTVAGQSRLIRGPAGQTIASLAIQSPNKPPRRVVTTARKFAQLRKRNYPYCNSSLPVLTDADEQPEASLVTPSDEALPKKHGAGRSRPAPLWPQVPRAAAGRDGLADGAGVSGAAGTPARRSRCWRRCWRPGRAGRTWARRRTAACPRPPRRGTRTAGTRRSGRAA